MTVINKKIAFIGAGNMAEALLAGLITCKTVPAKNIIAADIRAERRNYLKKKYKVSVTNLAAEAIGRADVIFLSVKPQQMEGLLLQAGSGIKSTQLVISIAAGITTRCIEGFLPKGTAVIRSMPNTPALLGAGAIAVSKGRYAGNKDVALAVKLFSSSGAVLELPESKINAVTALSGSGPAYVFYLCEAMARGGVLAGLSKEVADKLARQTVFGAGKMLAELAIPADELRRNVTSPGGTTEAAVAYLESNDLAEIMAQAVGRARKRAEELAK